MTHATTVRALALAAAAMLLPAASTLAMAPMGSGRFDVVACGMSHYDDYGPRPPCYVEWFQLNDGGAITDQRAVYRTDDYVTGMTVGDLVGDGRVELILALRARGTGLWSVRAAPMDRMGMLTGRFRVVVPAGKAAYGGLALGDVDADGKTDLLALRSPTSAPAELVRFTLNASGKAADQTVLASAGLDGATAVAFCRPAGGPAGFAFVAVPAAGGNQLLRVTVPPKPGGGIRVDPVVTISGAAGVVHGLAVTRRGGRPVLLVAIRAVKTGRDAAEAVPEMTHKGQFIGPLAAGDASQSDKTRFLSIPIGREGRLGKPARLDGLQVGRRWSAALAVVGDLGPVRSPAVVIRPDRPGAARKVLCIEGLFGHYYRIDELAKLGGDLQVVRRGVTRLRNQRVRQAAAFRNLEQLLAYDAVILADVPLWALRHDQLVLLEPYIRGGGRLVVFDGPTAGRGGGYADSVLEDLLPCRTGPTFAIRRLARPLRLPDASGPDGRRIRCGHVYYRNEIGPRRKDATVLLGTIETPLALERTLGRGRVILFSHLPLGRDAAARPGFWRSKGWPVLLRNILFRPARKGPADRPGQR